MGATATFTADLVAACKPPHTWASSAAAIGAAIDTFMKAVTITSKTSGAIALSGGGATTITAVSSSSASLAVAGAATLSSSCITAYTNVTWAGIGTQIANAIVTYVPTCVATVKYEAGALLESSGTKALLLPAVTNFITDFDALYTSNKAWDLIATDMANLIKSEFAKIILTTVDSGAEASGTYTGAGTGTLTWS